MRQLAEAMARIRSAGRIPANSRLSRELDAAAELAPLVARIEAMRRARPLDGGGRPAGLNLDVLWSRWQLVRPTLTSFSRRELRALCWDPRAVDDQTFLDALVEQQLLPHRVPFLRGLWHAYQAHWRLTTAPTIEALFRTRRGGSASAPKWLESVCDIPRLLGQDGPVALGWYLQDALPEAGARLHRLGVTPVGAMGREALRSARQVWLDRLARNSTTGRAPTDLAEGVAGLLSPELVTGDDFRTACERLVMLGEQGSSEFRDALRQFVTGDERLGHPLRSATSGNWIGFSSEAKAAAVRLFAARDLGQFFDILVAGGDDSQKRRQFWARYVESPQLVDFWIACDPADAERLRAHWRDGKPNFFNLVGAPPNHSAFIMRFRSARADVMLAEFSRANNAMYEFDYRTFSEQAGLLEKQRVSFRGLKGTNRRHIHRAGWHRTFEWHLNALGVRPGARE